MESIGAWWKRCTVHTLVMAQLFICNYGQYYTGRIEFRHYSALQAFCDKMLFWNTCTCSFQLSSMSGCVIKFRDHLPLPGCLNSSNAHIPFSVQYHMHQLTESLYVFK